MWYGLETHGDTSAATGSESGHVRVCHGDHLAKKKNPQKPFWVNAKLIIFAVFYHEICVCHWDHGCPIPRGRGEDDHRSVFKMKLKSLMGFTTPHVKTGGSMFENIDISKPALMRGGEGPHAKKRRRVRVQTRAPAQWPVQLPCWRCHLLSSGSTEEGHSWFSDRKWAATSANLRINNPQVLIWDQDLELKIKLMGGWDRYLSAMLLMRAVDHGI